MCDGGELAAAGSAPPSVALISGWKAGGGDPVVSAADASGATASGSCTCGTAAWVDTGRAAGLAAGEDAPPPRRTAARVAAPARERTARVRTAAILPVFPARRLRTPARPADGAPAAGSQRPGRLRCRGARADPRRTSLFLAAPAPSGHQAEPKDDCRDYRQASTERPEGPLRTAGEAGRRIDVRALVSAPRSCSGQWSCP